MTAKGVVLLVSLLLPLTACSGDEELEAAPKAPASAPAPSGPSCDGGPAVPVDQQPDYPDWVFADGRHYFLQGSPAEAVTLGTVVVRTRCRLADAGTRRGYQPQEGDATMLPRGTEVFEVVGRDRAEVLATRTADGVELWTPE